MTGLKMKYFVLNPHKKDAFGSASRRAILEYARVIRKKNKNLAEELESWILDINIKRIGKKNLKSLVPGR